MLLAVFSAMTISTGSASGQSSSSVERQMKLAQLNKDNVLMLVTEGKSTNSSLRDLVHSIANELEDVEVIEIDCNDKENSEIVAEYKIDEISAPLVLIFSSKGLLIGGITEKQATKKTIIDLIPTPKYNDISYSLYLHIPVMVIFTNADFKTNNKAISLCEEVKSELKNRANVVIVDVKDSREDKLLKMLGVKKSIKDSYIMVLNSQGMLTGQFKSLPTKVELVGAVNEIVHSPGCGCGSH